VLVRARDEAGSVRIFVEDQGPGVPKQLRPTLFDRGVTTKPVGGSGLGLNVSLGLMRQQGGDLRLTEGAKGGACFELTLPSADTVFGSHASRGGSATLTALKSLPGQARRSA
jgi:two-component system, NtrC family, sensor kinase